MDFFKLAPTALAFLVLGCTIQTDLGNTCVLVKKDPSDPTGQSSVALKEQEIKPNRDFISFGAVECEDLVCVREAAFTRPTGANDLTDAVGYCSRPCVHTSTFGCVAARDEDNKDTSPNKLFCRPLLLDEITLATIKSADPVTFKKYFGDTTSPYFCARGATPDGGT